MASRAVPKPSVLPLSGTSAGPSGDGQRIGRPDRLKRGPVSLRDSGDQIGNSPAQRFRLNKISTGNSAALGREETLSQPPMAPMPHRAGRHDRSHMQRETDVCRWRPARRQRRLRFSSGNNGVVEWSPGGCPSGDLNAIVQFSRALAPAFARSPSPNLAAHRRAMIALTRPRLAVNTLHTVYRCTTYYVQSSPSREAHHARGRSGCAGEEKGSSPCREGAILHELLAC